MKSGSLNLLEPSGPVQAYNGIAFTQEKLEAYLSTYAVCGTSSLHLLQMLSEVLQQNPHLHSSGISTHHSFAHNSTDIKEQPNKEHQSISTNKQTIIFFILKISQRKKLSTDRITSLLTDTISQTWSAVLCMQPHHAYGTFPSSLFQYANILLRHEQAAAICSSMYFFEITMQFLYCNTTKKTQK